jgi:kynurenine 3-monooxygenase
MSSADVVVVGAGPVGTLMALILAQRGRRVQVYERRSDPRQQVPERGRSINLALAARGLKALSHAGLLAQIEPELVRMTGRMLHDESSDTQLMLYGQREHEVIWSISRANLNRALVMAAAAHPGIELHFEARCTAADPSTGTLTLQHHNGSTRQLVAPILIAADGAGSSVRAAMVDHGVCHATVDELDHDYRELHIPARADGTHVLAREALHIWPRGGHMLIALPNTDGSFTATLFLPRRGPHSFDTLNALTFAADFPDAAPLIPDLAEQLRTHPQGQLGTLHCFPWHSGKTLLLGDAAHAIVPFHGQGLNCGFEDCLLLDSLLARHSDAACAFAEYENERRRDTDAIAAMALENYVEMRDAVRDPQFEQRKLLVNELERRFPRRFIPRYSMVMFHPEISYSEALHRGQMQERVMDAMLAQGLAAESNAAALLLTDAGL